jgi:hypothetical protein
MHADTEMDERALMHVGDAFSAITVDHFVGPSRVWVTRILDHRWHFLGLGLGEIRVALRCVSLHDVSAWCTGMLGRGPEYKA